MTPDRDRGGVWATVLAAGMGVSIGRASVLDLDWNAAHDPAAPRALGGAVIALAKYLADPCNRLPAIMLWLHSVGYIDAGLRCAFGTDR